ncbi:MAG: DUF554 domain-containing protein [Bacteroidota bacterium]|nr:DUF554 domain-containing protein [Bacteroidota bacterium]MDP4204991.1 DUF554 domain-containing protein [Bacteroidota bacterium]
MILTGTLVNAATVLTGSLTGYYFHSRLPKRMINSVIQGMGIITLFIGFTMAMKSNQLLIVLVSLVIGTILGEWWDIDHQMERFTAWMKTRLKFKNEKFSDGFITSFLLFCMGSMSLLGAIEDGLGNEPKLLFTKAVMDGVSSIALASALGISVAFSIIPLFIYQGAITLLTMFIGNQFSPEIINEMTGVGGIILIGMGLNIIGLTKIKVINMIPALVVAIIIAYFYIKH